MAALTITPASVRPTPTLANNPIVVGETVSAGAVLAFNATNNNYELADPLGNYSQIKVAITNGDATDTVYSCSSGSVIIGATVVAGQSYYLLGDGTIGLFSDLITGDRVIFLGVGTSTTTIMFSPIDTGVTL